MKGIEKIKLYKLIDEKVVECKDIDDYAEWANYYPESRIVGRDLVGNFLISTVFLGVDHNLDLFSKNALPVLFETMVFKVDHGNDLDCERYCTFEEAKSGHEKMAKKVEKWVKNGIK